ncbi:prenyltransferase/squalene oxidase repeat-containing protein [Paludisphaera mucosa]|uniref:Terpene cyclase/mutase family protein n=1 Tax=Paludisphaera mucosa TaxID=3030827 RepID=A0ABT6F4E6_9BACT|nr:prenyltransferase/squalene oxidase repeat-containing protein [Paludisphaera mucosa]MDG3002387.1 terpene cyclase/mutase family protein [Paludisphaera mucosa]
MLCFHVTFSLILLGSTPCSAEDGGASAPEARAIAYLGREVPRWPVENRCFSCHNNGDAARALYQAVGLGESVPDAALAGTTRWLERPEGWEHDGGERPFSDMGLARIQFAAALADAIDAGRSQSRPALVRAAELVAGDQGGDGSWRVDAQGNVGSPATYGPVLATVMARRSLRAADPKGFAAAVDRADRWLRRIPAENVLDAAAVLIGLGDADDPDAMAQRRRCLDLILKSESSRGGWGPFRNAPAEPFDAAVVLIALARCDDFPERAKLIGRGRAFLIAAQRPDGSWPETTRPPDGESYAQRLSTTGWALQALLATREGRVKVPTGPRKGGG